MSTLQRLFSQPVDSETEEAILQLLHAKTASAVAMFVQAVRAAEAIYGPEAPERLRQWMLERAVARAAERGAGPGGNSLRAYCEAMDRGCRGSHEWEKLEDSDHRQAYRYTRCLWADIYRALGAEDIGLWICQADGPVVAAYNPRIRFQRTQTLMAGDACCDHAYVEEDE